MFSVFLLVGPSKDVVCGYIACMRELLEQLTKLSDFSHQENNEGSLFVTCVQCVLFIQFCLFFVPL